MIESCTEEKVEDRINSILHAVRNPDRGLPTDVARALEHLDQMMDSGELQPGQRLIEAELAAKIGVGRGRIREALRILAGQGVIELRANHGAKLRSLSALELALIFEAGAGLHVAGFTLLLRRYPDLPPGALEDIDFAWARIRSAWGAESAFRRKKVYLQLLTDYLLIINYHSGNKYLNNLIYNLHYSLDILEFATRLDEAFLILVDKSYLEMHKLLMAGSERAIQIFSEMAALIVRYLNEKEAI